MDFLSVNNSPACLAASHKIEDRDISSLMWGTSLPSQIAEMSFVKNGSVTLSSDDIALIRIQGVMSKYETDMGVSTPAISAQVRSALREEVRGIMVYVDSAGGNTAGLAQLMDDVAAAASKIPVYAFIEDVGTSSAYFAICQSTRIIAGQTAFVGGLGVYSSVDDTSKEEFESGSVVHLFTTGKFKGAGVPGTTVTAEQKAHFQSQVDTMGGILFEKLESGMRRRLGGKPLSMDEIKSGKLFIGKQAVTIGLVDSIGTYDSAYKELLAKVGGKASAEDRPLRTKFNEPPKAEAIKAKSAPKQVPQHRGITVSDGGLSIIF